LRERLYLNDDNETESHSQFFAVSPDIDGVCMVDAVIPLNRLKAGQCAEVSRILGPAEHVHRLEEFGFRSGTTVRMFRPGNPCIVRMAGSKVCLRADELLHVLVRRNGTSR